MSCLKIAYKLLNTIPTPKATDASAHPKVSCALLNNLIARCSLVCGLDVAPSEPSFAWSQGVRLLWDNGGLILIDNE